MPHHEHAVGIADLLKDGSRHVDELAEATDTNPNALYRLLRALASVGIFAEGEQRQFSLTPLAEPLRSDVPGSQRALALMILRNCHAAMSAGGKLLVIESVIPPGNEPFGGKLLDLVMMLIPGGKERTEDEYRRLFDQAGFELSQVVPTETEIGIVEGARR